MVRVKVAYKQIKPPLVGEYAFPLVGFVFKTANVTFGGSGGIMSTARLELPYTCNSQAKSRDESNQIKSNYLFQSRAHKGQTIKGGNPPYNDY